MLKEVKIWLSNLVLKHLLNAVTEDAFLTVKFNNAEKSSGFIYLGGTKEENKLPIDATLALGTEARMLLKMSIWRRLTDSLKWTANDLLFNKSKSVDDMLAAKMILYTIDVMQKKLDNISRITEHKSVVKH